MGLKPLDAESLLSGSVPFEQADIKFHEPIIFQNTEVPINGKSIYIEDSYGVDDHTIISPDDKNLIKTIQAIIKKMESGNLDPSVENIINVIQKIYPRNQMVTQNIQELRKSLSILLLGDYFQSEKDLPYQAVCVHKALLAQAVASYFGYETGVVNFGFSRQTATQDREAGMHSCLKYLNKDGIIYAADPHKGIYEPFDEYEKRFINMMVFDANKKVFTPNKNKVFQFKS